MPKFKIKSWIAFAILGTLIYSFRNAHGSVSEYLISIAGIMAFWYLLGLQLALSNLRNLLILTLIFGAIIFLFRVLFPMAGPLGVTGALREFDLNPASISLLKESHAIALEIHLDHRPTIKDRYFKIGELSSTDDGLHYSNKIQNLDLSRLPQTSQWVKANLAGNNLDGDINKIKSWFIHSMTYTLNSGPLNSPAPLDQFLFERRVGFCEHFAASLSTILRLKGYQTRIVVGYAGGSWNPIFHILTFENADAHAWDEAYDPKIKQYTVIDPTSWIYPEVISYRSMEENVGWIILILLAFVGVLASLFVRKGNGLDRFMGKMAQFEKRHKLDPKGLTLAERLTRLASIEQPSIHKMQYSLQIYLKLYNPDEPMAKIDHLLKKSLACW